MVEIRPAKRLSKKDILSLIDRYGGKNKAVRNSDMNNTPRTQEMLEELYEDGFLERSGKYRSYSLTEKGEDFLVEGGED